MHRLDCQHDKPTGAKFCSECGAAAAIVRELAASIEDEELRRGFLTSPDESAIGAGCSV